MSESGIREEVDSAIDRALFAIKFNLSNLFGGLLYSLKLEIEKDTGKVCGIDELINMVVATSRRVGGGDYPEWIGTKGYVCDKKEKQMKAEAARITNAIAAALQRHGIQQAWNIGRPAEEVIAELEKVK